MPAAWYHLKGGKMSEGVYMDVDELPSDGKVQFKQCRSGFLVKISDKEYLEVGTVKTLPLNLLTTAKTTLERRKNVWLSIVGSRL